MSVGFIDAPPDLRPDAKKNTTEVYPNGETLHRGGYPWLQRLRDDTVAGGESSLTATADMSHPPTLLNLAKTGDLFRTTCSNQRLQLAWEEITKSGATILFRGDVPADEKGFFFPVTLLDNPPEDASYVAQEIFGPIRSVF